MSPESPDSLLDGRPSICCRLHLQVQKLADVHVLKGDIAKKEDVKTVMQQVGENIRSARQWCAAWSDLWGEN